MWPLKMTAREAEIQWRWFWMLLFRHSGQFWSFGAFFGHFWPFFSQFWPQTQTCRKLVMWPLKMIAREAEIQWRWFRMSLFRYSDHVRSFWAFFGRFWPLLANFGPKLKIVINWSCDHSKRSRDRQKSSHSTFYIWLLQSSLSLLLKYNWTTSLDNLDSPNRLLRLSW